MTVCHAQVLIHTLYFCKCLSCIWELQSRQLWIYTTDKVYDFHTKGINSTTDSIYLSGETNKDPMHNGILYLKKQNNDVCAPQMDMNDTITYRWHHLCFAHATSYYVNWALGQLRGKDYIIVIVTWFGP